MAVLCQFLDEIDYTTAFKAVQDRNSHDANDAYYDYFWDISMLEFLISILNHMTEPTDHLLPGAMADSIERKEFGFRLSQTNDLNKIDTCHFLAWHSTLIG